MSAYKKIIVGTDGSSTSLIAVDKAASLAADNDAQLLIVTAYEGKGADDTKNVVGSAPAQKVLDSASERASAVGATKVETQAIAGSPVDVLDQAVADSSADLLVIGNVGLNTLTGRVLGSVPQSVARRAGVDVLVVHTS